ncbi:MAG: hypothetical protein ACPGSB_04690 [Opitutales bacterium]
MKLHSMAFKPAWLALLMGLIPTTQIIAKQKEVLFICDPIQQEIVNDAIKELKGKIKPSFASGISAYDSGTVLKELDLIIGDTDWDLIYFNFGIADLLHIDPGSEQIRIMNKDAGGLRATSIYQYERNLNALVAKLKSTNTPLLWGTTTPLKTINFFPSFQKGLFDANSEIEYNECSLVIMERNQIPVIDFHRFIMEAFKEDEKHPPYSKYGPAMKKKGKPLHKAFVYYLERLR